MLNSSLLISLLLLVPPALAQVNTTPGVTGSSARMQVPPPVNSLAFPSNIGALNFPNSFDAALRFSGGYAHNLYPGSGTNTVDDAIFSLQPNLSVNRTTDRANATLQYNPTFDFYDPDSSLNTVNQTGDVVLQYRLAPFVTVVAGDTIASTSNTWSQPLSSASVSGGLPPTSPGFVAPFAPQVSNKAYGQLTWQYARNSMVGFGGDTTLLDFTKPSQAQGLFNSVSGAGSAFYAHRFRMNQYLGGLYRYSYIAGTPAASSGPAKVDLEDHSFLAFYTVYLQPTLSISLGAGSQRYNITQSSITPTHAWEPVALASLGWQVFRANVAFNYSRLVTEGQGIIGAYTSNSGNLSTQLQISPNWSTGVSGTYSQLKPVTPALINSTPGGHTLSFNGSLQRRLGPKLNLSFQYLYLHQTYTGIPSIAANPTSSRETASISYHFSRLLGR